ncbi:MULTISPECIES: hypothetical protein [unclassified Rhizobium]|uniref:hypothetical protein n=1 Tax=unclassified Rhizobium TaxID=2613769 RepID=UPI0007128A0F|nr:MULTISPECIES: hypothetical protein [unclassified Rhizobium]KQV37646.1 hypothetical protein ASC86_23780 [Rhizobium sp. Root1212]KRD34548.1 hypothetical protein ASE37_22350 [Rhizobium sp. Root268]
MTLVLSILSLGTFAAIVVGAIASGEAHQANSGWTYPPACCKAHAIGGDCEAIPARDVTLGPYGFSVFLQTGDHHLATRSHRFFIPYGDEMRSGDGQYHICLHPTESDVNCFFAPPGSA